MSRSHLPAFFAVVIALFAGNAFASTTPPPAVFLPDGGAIETDVNISNTNILGIIKQTLSSLGNILRPAGGDQRFSQTELASANICGVNSQEILTAIRDIKSIRVIVANYKIDQQSPTLMASFEKGLAKIGNYSRMEIGYEPPGTIIFAQDNNAGYVAASYERNTGKFVAVRLIGTMDVQKIKSWLLPAASETGKSLSTEQSAAPTP